MYPLFFFIIAIVAAIIHLKASSDELSFKRIVKILLAYIIPLNIGLQGIIAFIAHHYYGPETAKMIGWAPNSPFQAEIGFANLGLGLVGLLSIFFARGFWLATTIVTAVLFFGAASVHIQEQAHGDFAPYNSGPFLYIGDIFIPAVFLILALIYTVQHRFFRDHQV